VHKSRFMHSEHVTNGPLGRTADKL